MITAVYRRALPHKKMTNNISIFLIWCFQYKIHEHMKISDCLLNCMQNTLQVINTRRDERKKQFLLFSCLS
jgi:hypothetical protein